MAFPEDFLWGAATSAYQVEGATTIDGRGPSNWDVFAAQPGRIHAGETADTAADHYHRVDEDLELMAGLGLRAYRFSLSWTRIHPQGDGVVNPSGIGFYDRLIDGLLERSIVPLVTINHMELPQALERDGGWLERETVDRFVAFAVAVHDAFGDRVRHWMTLNEVPVTTWSGYGSTSFPPGLGDPSRVLPAVHHQLLAHGRAVREMRRRRPENAYGIVASYWPVTPASRSDADLHAAELLDAAYNRIGLDPLVHGRYPAPLLDWHHQRGGASFLEPGDVEDLTCPIDFFGLNYYGPIHAAAGDPGSGGPFVPSGLGIDQLAPDGYQYTASNWAIDARPLLDVLRTLRDEYELPVVITENGAAFDDQIAADGHVHDHRRISYLRDHLCVVQQAIAEGVDVRGYMVWSLIDNFEWASGYAKRFGLVRVDPDNQDRTPKASYGWYRHVIATNGRALADAALPV
ncbi:GH1 family beta-glucosidase [Nitriliruptor alkaliphilus]|uniref:GH1 family beta-glucosidase n=1 Tax=Nitriliruptor alkaliphilus TaxID=427918 RepID=UPI000695B4A3|nr:GH1 family beta-glucosidase [Nitriliruptor alkaliphilus]